MSRMTFRFRSGWILTAACALVLGHLAGGALAAQTTRHRLAGTTANQASRPAKARRTLATTPQRGDHGATRQTVSRVTGADPGNGSSAPPPGFRGAPQGFPNGGGGGDLQPGGPSGGPTPGLPEGPGGPSGAPGGGGGAPDGPAGAPFFDPAFRPWGQTCNGNLDGLASTSGIDLSSRGVVLRSPGPDLSLDSFTARTQCVPAAGPSDGPQELEAVAAVDRSFRSPEGDWIWLSQYPSSERTVNAIYPYGATFWTAGNTFVFWANAVIPLVEGPAGSATDTSATQEDANADLVARTVRELAPELDLGCFYRQTMGDWSDLEGLGIGDPRPVVPGGLTDSYFYLQYFEPPPSACDALDVDMPVYFSSSFYGDTSYFGIYVSSRYGGTEGVGTLDENNIWWTGKRYQYSVYGGNGSSSGGVKSTLLAIAHALDPDLDTDCLRRRTNPGAGILAALGLPVAQPPAGYDLVSGYFQVEQVPEKCTTLDPVASRSFYLAWTFQNAVRSTIWASASRYPEYNWTWYSVGWAGEGQVWWLGPDGVTSFSVGGYQEDGKPLPRSILEPVALSLDPTFTWP